MGRKVYTYRSIAALDKHPGYADLVQYPHVTATGDLYHVIRAQYKQFQNVVDVHALQKGIIANWEDPDIAFQQFINISRVIRNLPISSEEKIIHGSFLKNKAKVLNAIRLLVEADIEPSEFEPTCIEERLFQRIWVALENEDESFTELRVTMASYLEKPQNFESILRKVAPCMMADTIVLHGFYFITPIQERLFDMLEHCGKTLIFLCCIDDTVPEVQEIWTKVLSPSNKFDSAEKWLSDEFTSLRNQPFGSAFGKTPNFSKQHHISTIKYESEIDFVRDVKRLLDEDFVIYSTDVKATDELLKEFYPSVYKRRHLLAYPVGQYIYRLHSMWSTKDQCLSMSIDDIQACFASGWVEYNGVNALKHMHGLEKLKTYVSDCKTIDQWEARLTLLQDTKDTVLASFEQHLDNIPQKNRQWHRMMADPFLNLSCFDYDDHSLQELINLIKHLIQTARTLFAGPGELTIATHMAKVKKILTDGQKEKALLEEETAIIEELTSRLNYRDLGIRTCLPGEISEAITIVIGGGILDEDNYSIQSGKNETFIKPLYQVESAPILGSGKVHLCLADEHRLPGKVKPYVWPLNNNFLDRLQLPEDDRRRQYLNDMRFIMDNSPLANRYLFFSLLQNDSVEISWIATEEEKEISSSPYVQILEHLFQVPVIPSEKRQWSVEEVRSINALEKNISMHVDLEKETAVEAKMDVALCPWRYIYGYIFSKQPAFTSDFHYGFVLSNLIGALSAVSATPKQVVGDAVLSLFPYLRDVEKQQIIDHIPSISEEDADILDDASYPQVRLFVHFLQRRIKIAAEDILSQQMQEASLYAADLNAKKDYSLCMFCPYCTICPQAEHDPFKEA